MSLAYGGDWVEREGNFTYELLNLISAEQEDKSSVEQKDSTSGEQKDNNKGGQDTNPADRDSLQPRLLAVLSQDHTPDRGTVDQRLPHRQDHPEGRGTKR